MFVVTQLMAAAMSIVSGYINAANIAKVIPAPFSLPLQAAAIGLGYANAGVITAMTIAGAFDEGGMIPQGQYGVVSEYGDELVDGVLVKGKTGGTRVTSREDTAKMMNGGAEGGGGQIINQYITVNGAGDKALAAAVEGAARKGAKEGASMGYAMVSKDFKNGTGIRKQLKRSAGV